MLDRNRPFPLLPATFFYGSAVVLLWAWYGLDNGLGYETTLIYPSQVAMPGGPSAWLAAFLYYGDPLRKFTSVFYHAAYLMSAAFGREGDFIFYQIVWALLWCARGMLVALICHRLFAAPRVISYVVGLFAVLHASDHALNWVGQINQLGFIFWMLAAFCAFLRAISAAPLSPVQLGWSLASALFAYLSLWSYESGLFITAAFPVLAALIAAAERRFWLRQYIVPVVVFLLPVAAFVEQNLVRYVFSHQQTYQAGVLRHDWGVNALGGDLLFNVVHSLGFWLWPENIPGQPDRSVILAAQIVLAALILVSVALFLWRGRPVAGDEPRAVWRTAALMLPFGLTLVVLSFPAYVVLDGSRNLWRTQFLSGIGFAFTYGAIACALYAGVKSIRLRWLALAALCVVIGVFSAQASIELGAFHFATWEKHKRVIGAIVRAVPSVAPDTIIVLTGLPRDMDGFGHNMWFDVALRLAYPRTPVAGVYVFTDGTAATGANLRPQGNEIRWTGTDFPTDVRKAPASALIVLGWNDDGSVRILPAAELPAPWSALRDVYAPDARITCATPNPMAWRRYVRESWWRGPGHAPPWPCPQPLSRPAAN